MRIFIIIFHILVYEIGLLISSSILAYGYILVKQGRNDLFIRLVIILSSLSIGINWGLAVVTCIIFNYITNIGNILAGVGVGIFTFILTSKIIISKKPLGKKVTFVVAPCLITLLSIFVFGLALFYTS